MSPKRLGLPIAKSSSKIVVLAFSSIPIPVFLRLFGVAFEPRLPDDRGHRFDNGPSIFFPDPLQVKRIFQQGTVVITQFVNNPTRGPMCPKACLIRHASSLRRSPDVRGCSSSPQLAGSRRHSRATQSLRVQISSCFSSFSFVSATYPPVVGRRRTYIPQSGAAPARRPDRAL